MCLFIIANQASADTGACHFGIGEGEYNFVEPHNCKNGDTAIWSVDPANMLLYYPQNFIAYFCNLDGKIIQGIQETDWDERIGYVVCEFQQKVERNTN